MGFRAKVAAATITVATAVGAVGVGVGATPALADPGCAKLVVIVVPGTGESNSTAIPRMMAIPTSNLGPETEVKVVSYAASAWYSEAAKDAVPYGQSKSQGFMRTFGVANNILERCKNTKIALTGFSQGANVAGDVAAWIGTGRASIKPSQVAGVALLADLQRGKHDNLVGPKLSGEGWGGARPGGFGKLQRKTFTICEPKDEYCNTPKDYYLTRIAGILAMASDPENVNVGKFLGQASEVVGELIGTGPGNVIAELSNAQAREQILAFKRFLASGSHGDYPHFYVKPGVTALEWIHNYLAGLA